MAKAKITLNDQGPLTYHGNGYSLARGQSFITVKDEDIIHFSNRSGFSVEMLEGTKLGGAAPIPVDEDEDEVPVIRKPKVAKPKKSAPPPPFDEDEEETEEDEEEEEATGDLDEEELSKQTKASLSQLAEEKGLKVEANSTKAQLIALILSK